MFRKLRLLVISLLNAGIVAVEDSGYDSKEKLAVRMGCEPNEVITKITTSLEVEEASIRLELLKLQRKFAEEYAALRKGGSI